MADFQHATVLQERGQVADAMKIYAEALNENFFDLEALFRYGTGLVQSGYAGIAANLFKIVVEQNPKYHEAWQNLGNCFKYENKVDKAREIYQMGLQAKETPELMACMGNTFINNGTPHKALEWYEKAIKLCPDNGNLKQLIYYNMGLAYLELGLWDKGLNYYNLGFKAGNRAVRQYAQLPEWRGEEGKTVIFWGEQGLGDEIMFASCIPDAMKFSKRVIFDCHPRLTDTFSRSFGIECHGTRKNMVLEWFDSSDAECHASVTVLAEHVRKENKDFPGTAYLKADPEKVSKLREGAKRKRVGISWAGGSKGTRKDLRSIPLEAWKNVLSQDCDFYSLQYTPEAARQVADLEEKTGVHIRHFPNAVENKNYDETINFIASMDLVITVCTTVHHAAGALGVPCWTLVPFQPAWRYGIEGDKTPWYSSVKLIRQKPRETWNPVMHKVSEELCSFLQRA